MCIVVLECRLTYWKKLVYYTRLDLNGLESLTVKGVAGVLLATWFGCMLTFLLECRPIHLYWQVAPDAPMCAVSAPPLNRRLRRY